MTDYKVPFRKFSHTDKNSWNLAYMISKLQSTCYLLFIIYFLIFPQSRQIIIFMIYDYDNKARVVFVILIWYKLDLLWDDQCTNHMKLGNTLLHIYRGCIPPPFGCLINLPARLLINLWSYWQFLFFRWTCRFLQSFNRSVESVWMCIFVFIELRVQGLQLLVLCLAGVFNLPI